MAELLSEQACERMLADLPAWQREGDSIVRSVEFGDFPAAIAAVAAVAAEAEAMDHHPDMDIRWRVVTFRCATHSAGGLTELDASLARAIDWIVAAQ